MKTLSARMIRLATLFFLLFSLNGVGQNSQLQPYVYSGEVLGPAGNPVVGADVQLQFANETVHATTDADGDFRVTTLRKDSAVLQIIAAGFAPFQQAVGAGDVLHLRLALATEVQRVVVTATRTPLSLNESANSVQVISSRALKQSGTITFGDQLRQVTGVQFFRRSSTMVANPTSQGISLRGLGSTAASRTLVLADGIPMSDPFGGWVHWNQLPSLAIQDVEIVSGGISSLYGSSAIGGVVNIIERKPSATEYAVDTGYGGENTPHASLLGSTAHGPWSALAAADYLRTDGYIEVAPEFRGPIDTAANVHYKNGEVNVRRMIGNHAVIFLDGNILNEARGNGTPLQNNATRIWRYSTGMNWDPKSAGMFALRFFGSQEHYRQSFSSVPADQSSEALTRLQFVTTQQIGASLQWTKLFGRRFTLVAGSDVNDVRATDDEIPILHGAPNGLSNTTARQRDVGLYAEGLLQYRRWIVSGAMRGDDFLNLDAKQILRTGTGRTTKTVIANRNETMFSPQLGLVRRIDRYVALTASGYRAFRSPTLNELYRRSQVGQQITLANPQLKSERATGWETGATFTFPVWNTYLRTSYFWTEVNRPVVALTLSSTPSSTLLQRENLGQIRSRGLAIDYSTAPRSWLSVTGGYQYAYATVTKYAQQPQLIGNWIPQVPRNVATMQIRATRNRLGTAALLGTFSGRQYDNDANTFLLHGYFQLDGYVSHDIGSRLELYGAINNIFDRSIDVGRTPILTLGTPRLASFGLRLHSASR